MNQAKNMTNNRQENISIGNLLYDAPLHFPEQDRLGRTEFSRYLARAITEMDAEEGFVFGLYGPWGSGKSTIINFALYFLEEERKGEKPLIVVRFNPWWFAGQEQLIHQFFGQLNAVLGVQNISENLKNLASKLDLLAKILVPFSFVPAVGVWADRLKNLFQRSGTATKAVAEAAHKDIHRLRESIDETLKNQDARILVIMDDIDRLSAEEIRQVFQVVKAVANFPKTIYLLAFDQKMVAGALNQLQGGSGKEYLKKIVQVPLDLPLPDRTSLRILFAEQCEDIFQGTPKNLWDEVEWWNIYWDGIDPFLRTPRDVNRFVNILRVTYPPVLREVNLADFIGIQALRVFAPESYQIVASNKELFSGSDGLGSYERPEDRRNRFEELAKGLSDLKQKPVDGILSRLFPRWASAYGGSSHGSTWLSQWRKELRVCSPDVFDRYFMFSLAPGEISSIEMQSLLGRAENSELFGQELLTLSKQRRTDGSTRLRTFLEQLQDYTEADIPNEHIEAILRAIFKVGDQLFLEKDKKGMFDFGNDMRLLRISYQLLERLPTQQERFEILKKVFNDAKAVTLLAHDVMMLGQEHGKHGEKEPTQPEEKRTVAEIHLGELEDLALQKLRSLARGKRLHLSPDFTSLLYRMTDWGEEEEAKDYVSDLISNDDGLCDYLAAFLQVTHSHGMSDRVAKRTWRVPVASVREFLKKDPAGLIPRCKKILKEAPAWLDDRKRQALETFIQEIEEPFDKFGNRKRAPK
jgi:predicted KAP-like P-loop ATPase